MDCVKVGLLITELRKEHKLTQKQLADKLNLSDKTVSKWERGIGCPDISILSNLSEILSVNLESLLEGEIESNPNRGVNMKKIKFYICPQCGNLITSTDEVAVSCCGKKLTELKVKKATDHEKLKVELIENEYFISSDHEMTKDHYITFVALLSGDSIMIRNQYPEWEVQTRIPCFAHGLLIYHCSKHGLFYQLV